MGYFIMPVDALLDLSLLGFADDLGMLSAALATVGLHIDTTVKEQARQKLRDWFD